MRNLFPEWISLVPTVALSSPFAGMPSTLKVSVCVGAGGGGGVGLGVCAAFGHAVKSSAAAAKDSVKTAVVMSAAPLFCLKEKNLVFELLVFI